MDGEDTFFIEDSEEIKILNGYKPENCQCVFQFQYLGELEEWLWENDIPLENIERIIFVIHTTFPNGNPKQESYTADCNGKGFLQVTSYLKLNSLAKIVPYLLSIANIRTLKFNPDYYDTYKSEWDEARFQSKMQLPKTEFLLGEFSEILNFLITFLVYTGVNLKKSLSVDPDQSINTPSKKNYVFQVPPQSDGTIQIFVE